MIHCKLKDLIMVVMQHSLQLPSPCKNPNHTTSLSLCTRSELWSSISIEGRLREIQACQLCIITAWPVHANKHCSTCLHFPWCPHSFTGCWAVVGNEDCSSKNLNKLHHSKLQGHTLSIEVRERILC